MRKWAIHCHSYRKVRSHKIDIVTQYYFYLNYKISGIHNPNISKHIFKSLLYNTMSMQSENYIINQINSSNIHFKVLNDLGRMISYRNWQSIMDQKIPCLIEAD